MTNPLLLDAVERERGRIAAARASADPTPVQPAQSAGQQRMQTRLHGVDDLDVVDEAPSTAAPRRALTGTPVTSEAVRAVPVTQIQLGFHSGSDEADALPDKAIGSIALWIVVGAALIAALVLTAALGF